MLEPQFDSEGADRTTFSPFELFDGRNFEEGTSLLRFHAWGHFQTMFGDELDHNSVDEFYFNGYGVESLVKACRLDAGLDVEAEGIEYDSEGSACYIYFSKLEDAVATARLVSEMMQDRAKIRAIVQIAKKEGFDDG